MCSVHTKILLAALAVFIFSMAYVGCASVGRTYTYSDIESDLELVLSHKYKELVLIRADGEEAVSVLGSTTSIIAPRFSPEGDMIAFYDLGTSSGLPVSSTNVSLVVAPLDWETESELVSFPLGQFDTDHRLIVDDVIPPLWEPGGNALLIAHNAGIERITASGERSQLVTEGRMTAIALDGAGDRIIYATGWNIFTLERSGGTPDALLGPDFVPRFGNRYIRAMALSPEGGRLAFSMGHELFVVEMSSLEVQRIFEAKNRVYWIAWVPNNDQIVFVSGREFRGGAGFSPWMYDVEGKYRLVSITSSGELPQELFFENRLDARQAVPGLSPDGRFVSLTARGGHLKKIVLVSTDGSTVSLLTLSGPNSYASWRPVPRSSP